MGETEPRARQRSLARSPLPHVAALSPPDPGPSRPQGCGCFTPGRRCSLTPLHLEGILDDFEECRDAISDCACSRLQR